MSASFGHIYHPYEDMSLTFGDLYEITTKIISNDFDEKDLVFEKTDGQQLSVIWKEGKLFCARNKSHLKESGRYSLDKNGLTTLFSHKDKLKKSFVSAFEDLENALSFLNSLQLKKIFGKNENRFLSVEIINPLTENVIPYDKNLIVFHTILEYSETGNVVNEYPEKAKLLIDMIKELGKENQKKYKLCYQNKIKTFPLCIDNIYIYHKYIDKLRREFSLTTKSTLADYHKNWWADFIQKQLFHFFNCRFSDSVLEGLVLRWSNTNKKYTLRDIKKDIEHPKVLEWVLNFDRNDYKSWYKYNIKKFEYIFFRLGADFLLQTENLLVRDRKEAILQIKRNIHNIRKQWHTFIPNGYHYLKLQEYFNYIDLIGEDKIIPTEGIIFRYKNKLYKLTGLFAPINQILGYFKYKRR